MKHLKRLALFVAIFAGLYGFNLFLNFTYYNPAFIIPAYDWLSKHGLANTAVKVVELGESEELYPLISIEKLQSNLFSRPRAAVIGTVTDIVKVSDGDTHINVKDLHSDLIMILETVPEYPLPLPAVGQKIKIWGVTRYDLEHRWWELHPVFGWELTK